MGKVIGIFFMVALFSIWSLFQDVPVQEKVEVEPNGVMRFAGKGGELSHGCPVDGIIFTAHHVINPFLRNPNFSYYGAVLPWSDSLGNNGIVKLDIFNPARDLAILEIVYGDIPVYFRTAKSVSIGESVYWFEYNWEDQANAGQENFRESYITEIFAGHAITFDAPRAGASGSCLFNAGGEVVAVIVWRVPTDGLESVGFSVIIPKLSGGVV